MFTRLTYYTDYIMYYWTAPNGPYILAGQNDHLKDNTGYWVWINQNKTVTTTGEHPGSRDTKLTAGWNLVGFPATNENTTPNKIFIGPSYFTDYYLYYWTAPNGPYILVGQNDGLKDNRGYWVWINQDLTVTGSAIVPISDNLWVRATSKDDPTVFDNESGLANLKIFVPLHGVQVAISPLNQENVGGGTLLYNVTVKNTGNVQENLQLTKGDNAGWTLNLDSTSLLIPAGENGSATLAVTIPNGASGSTIDNIWVRATSKDNATVFDNESCLAQVKIVRRVQIAITPTFQENDVGGTLTYAVTVTNLSNTQENFQLTKGDNAGWALSIHDNWLLVQKGGNAQTNLTVTIPNDAIGGTSDDIWVQATSKDNATVFDNESCQAHVKVMAIMITPVFQENNNGGTLTYTVTVTNKGPQENFLLSKGDVEGWPLNLDSPSLLIPQGENRTAKLTVTIPSGAVGDTFDNIWVQATSKDDAEVFDNNSCLAHVLITTGVEVHVTPNIQENVQGENSTFTITVMNKGNVPDGFDLSWSDTENWGDNISLLSTNLQIDVGGEDSTSLLVHIPDNANPGTVDNISVTARSQQDAGVTNSDTCAVNVVFSRQVSVSISPAENGIIPGGTLTYTVIVRNIGDNSDNYILEASDNLGWGPSLSDNSLENLAPGGTRIIGLIVTVPSDAAPGAEDNITVTATSLTNENFTSSTTCTARSIAIIRSVSVTISPSTRDGMQGETSNFTIIIKNLGNVGDNYNLTLTDNAGWNPSISGTTVEIPVGENRSVTLSVTVPDNAAPQTMDKITVTVASQVNASVSNSASCQVTALILRGVMITISPDYGTGAAGAILNYTVKVTNTGRAAENYSLVVNGTTGWRTSILPSSLALAPGESGEATLSITVPSDSYGSSMIFYVWAISSADTNVRNNATCRAVALQNSGGEGEAGLSWIEIILIAAIIVAAVFTAGYLTRRRGNEKPRRVTRVLSLS
jgi:uncharacterized membrane protein